MKIDDLTIGEAKRLARRAVTRIERLSPEITALAASIGQAVHYHGGDYYLVPCQWSLWNTRTLGKPTPDGAETARRAVARMVEQVVPAQARPAAERIEAVCVALRDGGWQPKHITEVTTTALDRGSLSRWMGTWSVSIRIVGGPEVRARDCAGTREEAIEAAQLLALEAAP